MKDDIRVLRVLRVLKDLRDLKVLKVLKVLRDLKDLCARYYLKINLAFRSLIRNFVAGMHV